jgi:hypothetical protein
MGKINTQDIQVFWIKPNFFPIIQKSLECIYIKPDFRQNLISSSSLPNDCVLAGAILAPKTICVWAKPGVMHEDYIQLLENLFVDMGHVEQGFCQNIDRIARQCMQHALSAHNCHVAPVFSEYAQCALSDEF